MAVADLLNSRVTASVSPTKSYTGLVVFLGDDYLVLEEDSQGTIVLSIPHLKYCAATSAQTGNRNLKRGQLGWQEWMHRPLTGDFVTLLHTLKGTVVQLGGGGLDATSGYLADVKDDYVITVVIPEGAIYLPIQHIHSVIPIQASIRPEFMAWAQTSLSTGQCASQFIDALRSEIGNGIQLGRGGPEDISGILRAASEEFVEIVVSPHEVAFIPTHHVKAVTRFAPTQWKAPREAPIT